MRGGEGDGMKQHTHPVKTRDESVIPELTNVIQV